MDLLSRRFMVVLLLLAFLASGAAFTPNGTSKTTHSGLAVENVWLSADPASFIYDVTFSEIDETDGDVDTTSLQFAGALITSACRRFASIVFCKRYQLQPRSSQGPPAQVS